MSKNKLNSEEEFIQSILKKLSFRDNLPTMTILSLFLVVAIIVGFLYIPLTTSKKDSWSSGPISNEHRLLAKDCASCHAVPFEKVSNSTCKDCHKVSSHRLDIHANQNHEKLECTNCHMEHRGSEGLIVREEALCVSCHKDISKVKSDAHADNVSSFSNHPDFKVTLFLTEDKVNLSEAKDSNTLKFNHKVHLDGAINGPERKERLECASCHKLNEDKKNYQSIKFESSCERCHSLEFSKLAPNVKVPHAKPDEVYSFLLRFYANQALEKEGSSVGEKGRFIPSALDKRNLELFFIRKDVKEKAREIEHELFTKTSCAVCHTVNKLPENSISDDHSAFKVVDPENRESWFRGTAFDHSAHLNTQCMDCHKGVNTSKDTSDVLLPGVKGCKECHGDQDHTKKVSSTCVSCHPYHQVEGKIGKK
jgi:predicted CXXCH cytochrome family protein